MVGGSQAEGAQDRTRALAAIRVQTSSAGCVAPPTTNLPLLAAGLLPDYCTTSGRYLNTLGWL